MYSIQRGTPHHLTVGHCICFHKLLDVGSMMTIRVVTNRIIGEDPFQAPSPLQLRVLTGVIFVDSWYIYTMEYFSAGDEVEGNDILKFADKGMILENKILSEVTQIQKDKHSMYSFLSGC